MIIWLYILLALLVGVLAGTLTGLSPGIHINLVAVFLLSSSLFLLKFVSPIVLVVFIVAMSMTHTFVDFIPSIFLGAPDEDSSLSVLPGHEMLIAGRGYEAIILTLYGSIFSLIGILILSPLFIMFLPKIYHYVVRIMPLILILIAGYLIFSEKENSKKIWTAIIFFLAGLLGILVFNLNMNEPLLPLLTGLFGTSSLIISINKKQTIPQQKITHLKTKIIKKSSIAKSMLASMIASPLCSFLPGLGSGQAAVIGSEVTGDLNRREFLVLLGAINTLVMGLSFVTFYAIQKSRTGSAVAISKLLPNLQFKELIIILIVILISGILASFLTILIAKFFSKNISKINYSKLSIGILILLFIISFAISGILGLLVLIISTFLGLSCIFLNVKRTTLMGCLLLSTILYYLV
ncbi:MAG: tripartite tricarboxylate transporter permease [Nanoarchaeota archaeon]